VQREKATLAIWKIPPPDPSASVRAQNLRYYGFETPAEIVDRYSLGGATYFVWANNLPDPRQTAMLSNGLQRSALAGSGVPMLIATDEEQGYVHRLPVAATLFPGSMALGASGRADDAYRAAQVTGAELRAMGIHDAYAPVADVHLNPMNPVTGVRAYSDDPLLAARLTAAQVLGFQRGANVVATPKTFPGHGDTDQDSHVVLPVIDHSRAEWERLDAPRSGPRSPLASTR
jgi:beta-N-acetylhexosaminidase